MGSDVTTVVTGDVFTGTTDLVIASVGDVPINGATDVVGTGTIW